MLRPRIPTQAAAPVQMGPANVQAQVEATAPLMAPALSPEVSALVDALQSRHVAVCNEKARIEKAIQALTE